MDIDPPSPTLKGAPVEMSADCLLEFLQTQMKDSSHFHCVPHVLALSELEFKLSGRKAALEQAARCMKEISRPTAETSRVTRKIPVCSGLSGLGKTRMLEEWEMIFELAEIPEPRLGVLVLYHNGHTPVHVERKMTIESSFSWRLLHRCFLEGNGMEFSKWFSEKIPINGGDLTLRIALETIRGKYDELSMIKKNQILHLFIGIDEYQSIHEVCGIKVAEETLLQDLLNILGNIMASPVDGLRIYPMFAGTDFSIISIANSSKTESLRMPMTLLSQSEVENTISSVFNGDLLLMHAPIRRHLFYLGGVPRWVLQYVSLLLETLSNQQQLLRGNDVLSVEIIENVFSRIQDLYVNNWGKDLDPIDFVYLAAYSISGVPVVLVEKVIHNMKWSRVRDSSLCLLNENSEVLIPYAIMHLVAKLNIDQFLGHVQYDAIRCLILCLKGLIEKVDLMVYDKAPWKLWEVFGAYFHALRINSMIIVGKKILKLFELFKGALINGCTDEIVLKPMLVMETEDKFSIDIPATIRRKGNSLEKRDWLTDGLVIINGEGGKGVDIFFALKKNSADGHVICVDQRKRVAVKTFGKKTANDLMDKARIIPSILSNADTVVPCIFSCFASSTIPIENMSRNSVIVTFSQSQNYHGCLNTHPASSPSVNINADSISYIQMLFSGKDARLLASQICANERKYKSYEELKEFVNSCNLTADFVEDAQDRISFC